MKNHLTFTRHRTARFACAATVAAVLSVFSAQADAPVYVRVALVMGNAAYVSAPKLANPGNDAKAMAQTLRSQGFNVIEVVNGSKGQMQSGIAKIRDTLRGQAGIGMLYYAGHGLQLNDHNFMVSVEAKLNKANDIPKETVDVSEAIAAFKSAGNRMNIIVLDACRDNPFGKSSALKGLAPIDAPVGTFLAYATAPGNVAEDGDEKSSNGLYTSFLLQEMKKPNARIEDVFKRVRYLVRQKSEGRQVPWESTSLEEDFVFSDGQIVPPSKYTFETAKTAYETELAEWKTIGHSRNVNDFYAFLQKHPNSALTLAAQGKIDDLAKTNLIVQGGGADSKNAPLSIQPYKKGQHWATHTTTEIKGSTLTPSTKQTNIIVTDCDIDGCTVEGNSNIQGQRATTTSRYSPSGGEVSVTFSSNMHGPALNTKIENDPPVYITPPGLLQVGQTWKNPSVGHSKNAGMEGSTVGNLEGKVLSRERITTPAGSFDTFKVEVKTHVRASITFATGKRDDSDSTFKWLYWISPNIPIPVKFIQTIDTPSQTAVNTVVLTEYAER